MRIDVLPFNAEDLDEIALVLMEAFNSVNQGWDLATSKQYVKEMAHLQCAFAAKIESHIVGFVVADVKVDHLFVEAIAVLPSEQGKGVAKALWAKLEAFAKDNKLTEIKMIADPKSLAFGWYKRLGFEATGWVELLKKVS